MGKLGIDTDYDEDSLAGLTGEFAGMGATFFAPLAGKAKSGTEFVGRATKYINPIIDYIRRRPATAFATDLAVSLHGASSPSQRRNNPAESLSTPKAVKAAQRGV